MGRFQAIGVLRLDFNPGRRLISRSEESPVPWGPGVGSSSLNPGRLDERETGVKPVLPSQL
jgi:hypothetical protein